MSLIRRCVGGLADLVAPRRCGGCDRELMEGEGDFCGSCASLLEPVPCRLRPPARAAALYAYGGPLADAICRIKYQARTDLVAALARLFLECAGAYRGQVDAIVPVPLHPRRLRRRGFNQAALLVRPLARALDAPVWFDVLQRVRDTPPQASLAPSERSANVRGAFAHRAHRAVPWRRQRARLLVIDDVRTTGATLAEAAGALTEAGYVGVMTLALARAQ